jgi:hypothetical protein
MNLPDKVDKEMLEECLNLLTYSYYYVHALDPEGIRKELISADTTTYEDFPYLEVESYMLNTGLMKYLGLNDSVLGRMHTYGPTLKGLWYRFFLNSSSSPKDL